MAFYSKKGRILLIPEFSESGGTFVYFNNLLELLKNNQIETVVLITSQQQLILKRNNIKLNCIVVVRDYRYKRYPFNIFPDFFYLLSLYLKYRIKISTLSIQSPGSYLAVFLLPIKVNYIIHSRISSNRRMIFDIKYFLFFIRGKNKRIISVSEYSKEQVKKHWGFNNVKVVNNYSRFNNNKYLNNYANKNVITLGNLEEYKNPIIWIKTAVKVIETCSSQINFIWVGEGDISKYNNEVPNYLKNRISFIKSNNIEDVFKSAILYFHPSLIENLSLSIIEALSFSLPIVAFNTGGNSELVKNELNGYLVDNNNEIDFCFSILEIIKNQEKYLEMSRNSFEFYMNKYRYLRWEKQLLDLNRV